MMKLMLMLGIHGLLMLLYAAMVATGRSRMRWLHLLMALPLPLIGECCLLMAEMDAMPASPLYTSPFRRRAKADATRQGPRLPEDWRAQLHGDEASSRAFLLDVIGRQCAGLTEVLQEALHVPGSEVCHIAASTMMKLHSEHEEEIVSAQHRCECSGGSMPTLRVWIDAVDAYRASGLNSGASLRTLEEEETGLIRRYLQTMQQDTAYRAKLVRLTMAQAPRDALEQAVTLIRLDPEDAMNWALALEACSKAGETQRLAALQRELQYKATFWPKEKRRLLPGWEDDHAQGA
jgi:hypothetical protein